MNCLYCKKEFAQNGKQRYCSVQCQRKCSDKRRKESGRASECEKQRRNTLTDAMVKKTIYIGSKGKIKYNQITSGMIQEKRIKILAYRKRKANGFPDITKPAKEYGLCLICGERITTGNINRTTCSDKCGKEKARRDSFKHNSAKKILKSRPCQECGNMFTPVYGNKRRVICSKKCERKHLLRNKAGRKDRARARHYGVAYQYINPIKVFERDGWTCQICLKPTPKKNRGKNYPNSPEVDHRIPISKGGDHLYSNVQCCCRKCNGSKSNRSEAGQINLFELKSIVYRGLSQSSQIGASS